MVNTYAMENDVSAFWIAIPGGVNTSLVLTQIQYSKFYVLLNTMSRIGKSLFG